MSGNVRLPIMYWPCPVGSMLKCLQLWREREGEGGRERGREGEREREREERERERGRGAELVIKTDCVSHKGYI